MRKAATKQMVRFRVDLSSLCSIGPGKVDLLEAIERTGKLSHAAKDLGMSYAYAWLILNDLNRSFAEPVTRATMGGNQRGGVTLTAFGQRIIRSYRSAAQAIESALQAELEPIAKKAVSQPSRKIGAPRKRLTRGISLLRSRATGR
jgi:molybdate transport system regulatory protein